MSTKMDLSADAMVEMSLDDIIKKTSALKVGRQKRKPNAEGRKSVKAQGGIPAKKPGQNAQKATQKAKKNRDNAFNKGRGIQLANAGDVKQGGNKKRKNKGPASIPVTIKPAQGGGNKGRNKGASQGGNNSNNKQVLGNLQLPKDVKLPPGTTLKISIQNDGKATATAITPPARGGGGNNNQQQQQKRKKKVTIRTGPKAVNAQGLVGQNKQNRRVVLQKTNQNKRDRLFNSARGVTLATQGSGGGGGVGRGGAKKGQQGGGVRVGGNKRKVVVRRKNK